MEEDDVPDRNKRVNAHHTLPRSRVWTLRLKGYITESSKRPLEKDMHNAYHALFNNRFPWEVENILKSWSAKMRSNSEEPFYSRFSEYQYNAFQLLFGFTPGQLGWKKNLNKALDIIKKHFYASPESFHELISFVKENGSQWIK